MCAEPKLPSLGHKYTEAGMQKKRERGGGGEKEMGHMCGSRLGTKEPEERPNLNWCWNLQVWIISRFEILYSVNWEASR